MKAGIVSCLLFLFGTSSCSLVSQEERSVPSHAPTERESERDGMTRGPTAPDRLACRRYSQQTLIIYYTVYTLQWSIQRIHCNAHEGGRTEHSLSHFHRSILYFQHRNFFSVGQNDSTHVLDKQQERDRIAPITPLGCITVLVLIIYGITLCPKPRRLARSPVRHVQLYIKHHGS